MLPRCLAVAAACLLLLGAVSADQSNSATVAGSATGNLTGSVYDVACPCESLPARNGCCPGVPPPPP